MTATSGPSNEFLQLIAEVQGGDEDAARRLFERYGPYLVRAIRRRLQERLRSQFDSIDFAQDVWASFFAGSLDKYHLTTPSQLVALLTTMARNKVAALQRQRTARQKYNVCQERSLDDQLNRGEKFAAAEQTPSQNVMDKEAWDTLLATQPPVYRRILLLLRDGMPHETIARELGVSLRTVQRVLSKLNP